MDNQRATQLIPTFHTRRLLLRAVEPRDVPAYQANFVDYQVISQLAAAVPWPFPAGGVADYLEQQVFPRQGKDRWVWGIFLASSLEELIGCVDLWREGKPEHRGFWLGTRFWGNGYMTEAVVPVTTYAFTELGFAKLVFSNAVGNIRSRRIKEKSGARLVDVRRAAFVNPHYTEHEIWELTRADWDAHLAGVPRARGQ